MNTTYGDISTASTSTTLTYFFIPKHSVQISLMYQDEINEWVRKNTTKGFMLGYTPGGHPTVQFIDDVDFSYFLLKWVDYVVRRI